MTYHAVEIPTTNRDNWLDARRQGIGASDVAGIVGVSPYATPFTVWADKIHDVTQSVSEQAEWGSKLEGLIADEFEERTGLHVWNRQILVHHPDYPWAMATLDGLVYESGGIVDGRRSLGNYEGKTSINYGRWDEIPAHYEAQIQWQLYVTGNDNGWLTCLHGNRQLEIYEYERDQPLINRLVDMVAEFRGKHLTGGLNGETPPPPDVEGHNAEVKVIADLWADPVEDKKITLSAAMASDLAALRAVKAEKARIEQEEKRLSSRLKVSLQDAEIGLVDGAVAVTYKKQKRAGFVVEPNEFRVLRLTKEKA